MRLRFALPLFLASAPIVLAVERPSFMQSGDAFCTNEGDFTGFVQRAKARDPSATQACRIIATPTRVAILSGQGGIKTMIRIMSGTNAYEIGWTDGKLPVQ